MGLKVFAVVLVFALSEINCKKLPDYITPCSQKDPNLNECARLEANKAIKRIKNGYKPLRIPSIDPMLLTKINVEAGGNLQITLENVKVYGLPTTVFDDISINLEKKEWMITGHLEQVMLLTDYEINGKILVVPIQGKGPGNITFTDSKLTYTIKYDIQKLKSGAEHAKVMDTKASFKPGKIYYQLDNLFNGNEKLGEEMNKFLNENWDEVGKEITPGAEKAIETILVSIASNFLESVPFNDIIIP